LIFFHQVKNIPEKSGCYNGNKDDNAFLDIKKIPFTGIFLQSLLVYLKST